MSAKILNQSILEKKYIPSRFACLALSALFVMYLIPFDRGIGASIFAGTFIVVFIFQFFRQSKILNVILGGIILLLSFYFSLAVLSEFNEFETVTKAAKQLLLVGWGGCLFSAVLAFLMIRRAMLD